MFNNLEKLIKDNMIAEAKIDAKMIAEAKIDASYPIIHFSLENYHQLLKIRGILVYVKSSVASRQLKCDILLKPIQNTPFELHLRKDK